MADKRWMRAFYAAALLTIIITVVLLCAAFIIDAREGEETQREESAESFSTYNNEAEIQNEAEEVDASVTAASEDHQEQNESDPPHEEQPDQQSTAAEDLAAEKSAAEKEILSLSGKELWKRFDGAVLTGDSRVVGFALYTDIPSRDVLAKNGAMITDLAGFIPEIAARGPKRVFIAYGINDIKSAVGGKTAGEYAQFAEKKIRELEENLDGAEIFVNSILPASPSLEKKDSDYRKVKDYNRELEAMCRRCGWHYIDNSSLAVQYGDLYVEDGIHLTADFYEHWGRNMLIAESCVRMDEGGTGFDR